MAPFDSLHSLVRDPVATDRDSISRSCGSAILSLSVVGVLTIGWSATSTDGGGRCGGPHRESPAPSVGTDLSGGFTPVRGDRGAGDVLRPSEAWNCSSLEKSWAARVDPKNEHFVLNGSPSLRPWPSRSRPWPSRRIGGDGCWSDVAAAPLHCHVGFHGGCAAALSDSPGAPITPPRILASARTRTHAMARGSLGPPSLRGRNVSPCASQAEGAAASAPPSTVRTAPLQ